MLLPVGCSIFSIMLMAVYFSKQKIRTIENRIFSVLIVSNFIGLILEILCHMYGWAYPSITSQVILKSYIVYCAFWILAMTFYVWIVTTRNLEKTMGRLKILRNILLGIFFPVAIVLFVLPIDVYSDIKTGIIYSYGIGVDMTYYISLMCIILWIVRIGLNFKVLKDKKSLPILLFLGLGLIMAYIQRNSPEILLMTSMELLVTSLMFFTIENPDLRLINELNLAKDEAEKANKAKTDFLSSMSHEIRTPLNAIVGFSNCIIEAESIEEAKENASDIVTASNILLEIVNGILDISKIEAGKLEITNSSYDFQELIETVIKLAQARLGDKVLDFRIKVADDIPSVLYGDQANIKKVILNLLTNAIKYTEEGFFELSVNCIKKNSICRLVISVEDSGRGIKEKDIDKLFTKFQRFNEERNTTLEGTGLGLAITKRLVELMGGKILVHSVYGKGSKFTIILDQKIKYGEAKIKKDVYASTEEKIDLSGKKVLIVDDNKLNLKVAEKLLSKYNLDIELIDNGFECIEKINNDEFYDLILMDDMMPKMSGVETFKKLKENPDFNVKTIALTANAISGMKEKYLNEGFDGYLAKPIEKNELEKILKSL